MSSQNRAYEAFRLWRQDPSVALILPQESADTSKADSNRKEGALYGFFTTASHFSPDESVFSAFVLFVI